MTLKDKLKEAGITYGWLCERLGLSRPALRKYLKKPDEFKVKHLVKISEYLQITERDAINNYFQKSKSYE